TWHLATTIDQSIDGWNVTVNPVMRFFASVFAKKRFLARAWPSGIQMPKGMQHAFLPPPTPDDEGVKALRTAIDRLTSTDTRHASPLLGEMSVEQYDRFHRNHAAMHLSHLVPNEHSGNDQAPAG
ncbi:MAG: DUF1569 domain-containing protein, partial [Planctomycetota bacterium]